jgi:prepilin-type N-terminal cleavage/methylation domain-containing protein
VRALLRRRLSGDAGMSLAELLVAMAVTSLVLVMGGAMFAGTYRTTQIAQAKTTSSSDARIAMELLSRDLRVAIKPSGQPSAIVFAGPDQVTFFRSRGPATPTTDPVVDKLWYWVDASAHCLARATAVQGVGGWPTTRPAGGCVAQGDLHPEIFTYFPVTTGPTPPAALAPAGSVIDGGALPQVAAVDIRLKVTATGVGPAATTELTQHVTLTNVTNDLQRGTT